MSFFFKEKGGNELSVLIRLGCKKIRVIVILVPKYVISNYNSPSMYTNFKIVFDWAFC